MSKMKIWGSLAGVSLVSLCLWQGLTEQTEVNQKEAQRLVYEEMVAQHPFSQSPKLTPIDIKKIPKKDRPDLAWEHDFIMTMDPNTGQPEKERLLTALNEVKQYKRNANRAAPGSAAFPWEERGPNNFGGRTRAILWDPNVDNQVWAGGVGGGLWFNTDITDANMQWNKIDDFWDNIAISAIAADGNNSQIFYVGTGEGWNNADAMRGLGLWKTSDGGTTWNSLPSTTNSNFRYTQKIVVDETNGHVYAATNSGLRKSTDGGNTWTKVLGSGVGAGNNFINDVEIAADGSFWCAVGSDGVYRSTSGNAGSWTDITNNNGFAGSISRIELSLAPSDANTAYTIVWSGGMQGIFKTTNQGASWTSTNLPNDADTGIPANDFTRSQGWYDLISDVDPNNPNHVYVGGIDLFHSLDGGSTWEQISHWYGGFGQPEVHADQHGIEFKPGSSNEIIFSHDGGVTYSPNATALQPTVGSRVLGYNVTQFYACAMNPTAGSNNYLAGAQDNGSHRFNSPGMNSTTEVTGGDGMFCHIDQTDGSYQFTSYVYNNYYRSTNTGNSFGGISGGENTGRFVNPTDLDDNMNILYGARNSTELRRISNLTGTPNTTNITIAGMGGTASCIKVSPFTTTSSTLFVGTGSGRIFKVTNANATPATVDIDPSNDLPNGYISCIQVGASENELLVTFSNYGVNSVWYTANGGNSWVSKEGNLPDMPIRWALFNPDDLDEVILATEVGVWSTASLSATNPTWIPSNSGLANTRVDMLQLRASDNQVTAATHGRGLYSGQFFTASTDFNAGVTSIEAPTGNYCTGSIDPEVTIKNFGSVPLTAVEIIYNVDGGSNGTFNWTGSIPAGGNEVVSLPAVTVGTGNHVFTASTNLPNGNADEDTSNDSASSSFFAQENALDVIVSITTDCWGSETSWNITDENGNIIFEVAGSTLGNQATFVEQVCVGEGCYDFNLFDSFGDGLSGIASGCSTDGSYNITDGDGNILVQIDAANPNFGSDITHNFCLNGSTDGCTDNTACNYNENATTDDGSCEFISCAGCTDENACNYNPTATIDDSSCEFISCAGCTDQGACNFDQNASLDDNSCEYTSCAGCIDQGACNFDAAATIDDASCEYSSCAGCTDIEACNYDQEALLDNDSCDYSCYGCTDNGACNYNSDSTLDDGSCEFISCAGCTDIQACNYDATATLNDGSCDFGIFYYPDVDGDGYGDPENGVQACTQPTNYVTDNTDCMDDNATVYPGASGTGVGLDNNCNNTVEGDEESNACSGDMNSNGVIDISDMLILLADMGCTSNCVGDLDGNGSTDTGDLLIVIQNFGFVCD